MATEYEKLAQKFRGKNSLEVSEKLTQYLNQVYFNDTKNKYKNFSEFMENCKPKEFHDLMKLVNKANPDQVKTLTTIYYLMNKYTSTSKWEIPDDLQLEKMIEGCLECQLLVRRSTREAFYEHVLKTHSLQSLETQSLKNFSVDKTDEIKKTLQRYHLTPIMLLSCLREENMIPENSFTMVNEIYKQDYTMNEILYNYEMMDMLESCTECEKIVTADYSLNWQEHLDDHIGDVHRAFMEEMLRKYPELYERIEDILVPSNEVEQKLKKEFSDFQAKIFDLPEDEQRKKIEEFEEERQRTSQRYFSFGFPYKFMKKREEMTLETRIKGEEMVKKMIAVEKELFRNKETTSKLDSNKKKRYGKFLTYAEAQKIVKIGGIVSQSDYSKKFKIYRGLPSNPKEVYCENWISWEVFLGIETNTNPKFLSYANAKELVNNAGIKSWREYRENYEKLSDKLPSHPDVAYKDTGWKGWSKFLHAKYKSLEDAKKYAILQNLHSTTDWLNHTKSTDFPNDIPIRPDRYYKNKGWISYGDFCGFERKVKRKPLTKEVLKKVLKMLDERWNFYKNYTDGMFTDWFTTQGLFSIKDPIMKTFFTEFISWRHKPEGREAIRYWLVALQDYLETGVEPKTEIGKYSLKPKKEETVYEYLDRQHTRTQDYEFKGLTVDEEPIGIEKIMIEAREVVPTNNDKKWFDTQVDFTVGLLWQGLFQNEDEKEGWLAIQKEKMNGNAFHDAILRKIKLEYQDVKQLNYDKDFYTFGVSPTLFQLYTAWKMRKVNGCLNMGSTGTGKTLAAIISARATRSKQVFVVCPNNIVEQWIKNIKKVYGNSFVSWGKEMHPNFFVDAGNHLTKFHVVNYDKFGRQKTADNLIAQIKEGNIDFIIIDEAQFIKKREIDQNYESNRRKNISLVINHLRKYNRKLKIIMLSATPVINNIREGVSLLNMLTGTQYGISTSNTIRNASKLYVEFQPFSINYQKRNNITEVGREVPIMVDAKIPDIYKEEEIMNFNWLQLEQIATKYRIPKILEILSKTNGKTVIYTDYVTGIVSQLQDAISKAGHRVGLFTGEDKSGLVEKLGKDNQGNDIIKNRFLTGDIDVLIASRPFAVGIDEIQYVCNNLIFNGLVWTYAEFEQIIGRVVRTGQAKSHVNIHLVLAKINGYDYDMKVKYNRLLQKKAIGDCVRYGTLPEKISFGFTNSERYSTLSEMIKNKKSGFPDRHLLHLEEKKDMLEEQIKWLEQKSK